jgi:hypothetical protein
MGTDVGMLWDLSWTGAVLQEGSSVQIGGSVDPQIEVVRSSGRVRGRLSHRHGLRLRKAQIEAFVVHLLRI